MCDYCFVSISFMVLQKYNESWYIMLKLWYTLKNQNHIILLCKLAFYYGYLLPRSLNIIIVEFMVETRKTHLNEKL